MISTWVFVVFVALSGIVLFAVVTWFAKEGVIKVRTCVIIDLLTVVGTVGICALLLWYLYGTEAGKREIKDTQSNLSGGIERTVTVYDIDGDVIESYSGKFDVDYDEERIIFDDEDGKRHIIYYSTGTVTINEN